ncbi:putative Na+/H+ antiporter [Luteimonas composti]|uniref:Na+/H+ antiporter n=1 Tax=Luteimonas composti TaxID=398257 RepID=A0ABT6MUB1_9GAMM|nr:putative Na+/H+ antiporter [Luteimonas composti]MDH7454178.1 putative Na+/H+ antiporter [Luteimonas composti]
MSAQTIEIVATVLFALAILHTFSTKFFLRLAHRQPAHAGSWHLLGEVEVVFGIWAMVLVLSMALLGGVSEATAYVDSRNFTEPMFVFAIMVIAGTRPVLWAATRLVDGLARMLPWRNGLEFCFSVLALVPLLGSFITEPAAMTLAALMLARRVYAVNISNKAKYALLGTLFVNVSIGGVLTPFAAPPVLMVAAKWNWDFAFMMTTFGWKAIIAVVFNAAAVVFVFRKELGQLPAPEAGTTSPMSIPLVIVHLLFLLGVVAFAHHPAMFMGIFLLFLGVATAYRQYQDRLILREGLLVAFFLAGLVVLGGMQAWWLEPLLMGMSSDAVFFGAAALTAVTDNAALTYLGSLVEGLSDEFKYMLVAGAVAGGGLTVIANAPNPAGMSIVRRYFNDESVHPLGLLLAALPPTLVAIVALRWM